MHKDCTDPCILDIFSKIIVTQPKNVIFCYCCILNGIIFKCKAAHFLLTQCFKKKHSTLIFIFEKILYTKHFYI